ncbi:hypothetical protein FNU79_18215 [Deinococcus detaillensis]|uniref:Uncharacterized protein n=1 Tax=Deinococcus detaillensis TaxID=2592048 RepID=A0A553UG78_9DEIO|nr:hypothetical protein [Deinococcus detaillensis]TSA79188.1 hypothetical protein FNU79_18215 [Deinococcus detaillensis]
MPISAPDELATRAAPLNRARTQQEQATSQPEQISRSPLPLTVERTGDNRDLAKEKPVLVKQIDGTLCVVKSTENGNHALPSVNALKETFFPLAGEHRIEHELTPLGG